MAALLLRTIVKKVAMFLAPKQADKVRRLLNLRRVNEQQSKTIAKLHGISSKLRVAAARPSIVVDVASGICFEQAVCDYVRKSTTTEDRILARAFVHSLYDNASQKEAGALGFATMLTGLGLYESAFHFFQEAGDQNSKTFAPYEYFESFLFVDIKKGLSELKEYLAKNREHLNIEARLALMKALAKYSQVELLREETNILLMDKRRMDSLSETDQELLEWFNKHLNHNQTEVRSLPGTINFAVMDYKLLDKSKTSRNRGDYVQSLAAVSNLLRFQKLDFVGDTKLSNYLNTLKMHIHPERQITTHAAKIQPVPLNRDFSSGREYPENTWLISNGWFMHRNFNGPVDFPYPKNVLPIMISFHIQDPDVLTEDVVRELKRVEPIGCRDWTTVYRLRDFGIKAFFSGCITTTVGQILPDASGAKEKTLAQVEARVDDSKYQGWEVDDFAQFGGQVRDFDLVEGLEDAREMLAGYANYSEIVTNRLHCYLPALSMGLSVEFKPKNLADVRYEGLINLDQSAFNKIRSGVEQKLEIILKSILEGKTEQEVRKLWSEICQAEVEYADTYATTYSKVTASNIDINIVVATLEASKFTVGKNPRGNNAVQVALALDQNLEEMIPVVLQSLVDHSSREFTAYIMTRGLGEEFRNRMGKLFPQINFIFYSFDEIQYGDDISLQAHTSVSTLDRLFIPEMLKDLDKVLYLDIDILIQADVGELFDLTLGENVFAGKRTRLKIWANMIRPITRATLHFDPEKAWDFRKRLHDQADLTAKTFNAGILVLNLKLMRNERFTAEHLYLVEQCRMNDQDVFNIYSRGRVLEIGAEWNHVPSQDFNNSPKIIHWAGPAKPWKSEYVLLKPHFEAVKAKVEARL